ncbi:immune inhibitor A, partial [bacterium]|nr:immune inhibitor A [bacterium]
MARVLSVYLVAVCLLAVAMSGVAAGSDGPYVQVRVEFSDAAEAQRFMSIEGLDIMKSKPGVGVQIVTDYEQIAELRALGFDVVIEIDDMESFYSSRIRGDNFGDFHTYSETIDHIDALRAAYPSIVGEKIDIATTEEGRTVWAFKISDNPGVDEPEPEVLFDALHHAREPITIDAIIYFMDWLTSNYGTDPEATFLVDNREIWFIPVVNPDGYCYNETQDPGGGGMWRKNRRDNAGSTCYGVDPNRNYDWEWGTSGISYDPCSDIYCGTAAFSEPEIAGYRDFVVAHDFVTNITFHSVVGAILVPWAHTSSFTPPEPDNTMFHDIANAMAVYNGYEVGTAWEVISYTCSGTTTDWLYGAHGIWSVCIEVGGSGFWPLESEIPGLAAENLWPQQYMSRIAGAYLALEGTQFAGGNGDQEPDAGETLDLTVTIENQGILAGASNVHVTLLTDDPYVDLHDAYTTLGTITAGSTADNSSDPFSFSVDASTPDGHGLIVTLVIEGDDLYMEEQLSWMVGEPTVVFFDDMESGTGNWVENDGYWGLTSTQSHSPSTSYTDSPTGDYGNYRNTWIELAGSIDFSAASAADLSFWHRVDTEEDYDYCYVEVSDDGGSSWNQIGPKYHGNNYGWEEVELSLNDYVGTSGFKLRFRFTSDTYVVEDGWYVDDVTISGPPTGNTKPTVPVLNDPPD